MVTSELGYGLWDADSHYYETPDCFTRHIESSFADEALRPRTDGPGGQHVLYLGERALKWPPAKKFGVSEPPGSLMKILRNPTLSSYDDAKVDIPIEPQWRDRTARLREMDRQGVEASVLLPTVGVAIEHELLDNVPALWANVRAFNRWLEDDWGYDYQGRIFGIPYISLWDLDAAVAELERVVAAGARAVNLRPSPVHNRHVSDPYFDPFWARVNEMRIPVAFHVNAGLNRESAVYGENPNPTPRGMSAFQWAFVFCDRPIMDTLGAMYYDNLFEAFPNLRVLSIENGSSWVPYFRKVVHKGWRMGALGPWTRGRPQRRPSEVFDEHVFIAPFPEDDNKALVERLGPDRVLFGSDYPHPEGEAQPIDFAKTLAGLPDDTIRKVMRDNLRGILTTVS